MTKHRSGHLAIVPATAVFDCRLSATEVRILAAISTYADRNGRCWPAVSTLAERVGVSERYVSICIHTLAKFDHLGIEARSGQSNVYRIPPNYSSGVEGPTPEPQFAPPPNHSSGDPRTTVRTNDTKNDTKNEDTYVAFSAHAEFETFWQLYPSRRPHSNPKKPALAKFTAAVKNGTPPEDMIRGAQNYAAFVRHERTEPKYVAQAQTWLNQERWTEYQSAMPVSEAAYDSDVIH